MKPNGACLAVLFTVLLCQSLVAQVSTSQVVVPRLVNFSGHAIDAGGKPVSGVAGLTFAIYKDQSGGAPLWLETQNVQADAKGNYTVQLGATQPAGLPLDLFTSGEARWLGVRTNGGEEQLRILLLSVPYALKAADAETIGGLPPSAFVLAAPPASGATISSNAPLSSTTLQPPVAGTKPVTTAGGTVNQFALWDSSTDITSSAITQTGSGGSARIGINNATPSTTLDVGGGETVRGNLGLPATGAATTTTGKNSQPLTFTASAYNTTAGAAVPQSFRWQAEPAGNNTAKTSGSLNLLYSSGGNALAETGLHIGSSGQITFAKGQTFPNIVVTGTETVQGNITASGQLISTAANGTAPLKVASTTQVANLNASLLGGMPARAFATLGSNAFVGNQTITGSLGIGTNSPAQALDLGTNNYMVIRVDPGDDKSEADGGYSLIGRGTGGVPNTWWTFTAPVGGGFGVPANSYSIWQYPPNSTPGCCLNRLTILPAEAPTDTGGTVQIDQNGNTSQPLSAGGMVKAALVFYVENGGSVGACFNSTLSGAAATNPPCGFSAQQLGAGNWVVLFPFSVSGRVLSATAFGAQVIGACGGVCTPGQSNEVLIREVDPFLQQYFDVDFSLVVY